MKVRVSFTIELDQEAQEAWMKEYGVSKERLRRDVQRYYTPNGGSYPEMELGARLSWYK